MDKQEQVYHSQRYFAPQAARDGLARGQKLAANLCIPRGRYSAVSEHHDDERRAHCARKGPRLSHVRLEFNEDDLPRVGEENVHDTCAGAC